MQVDLQLHPWVIPYVNFLAGSKTGEPDMSPRHVSKLELKLWEAFDLTEGGSTQSLSDKGITAIRRHVVLWHRPDQKCFTRHSDLGMTLEHCNTRLLSVRDMVIGLVAAEVEKSDTILGVHVDAIITLDYMILEDEETIYSIIGRMCPAEWTPLSWITDYNLLLTLKQRRIPLQSRQVTPKEFLWSF
ncbi:MAG: hypothetical protein RL292_294 [Candidatus Parcubacteria bacterium]